MLKILKIYWGLMAEFRVQEAGLMVPSLHRTQLWGTKDNGYSSYKVCGCELLSTKIKEKKKQATQGISNLHLDPENTVCVNRKLIP